MKFSIDAEDFRELVKRVIKIVPTKSTLPVLEHIHLTVKADRIIAVGTDQDVTLRAVSEINPLNVIEPGEILLPAKRLKDGLELAKGMLSVTIEDGKKAIIKGKGRKFEMNVLSAIEYFEMPYLESEEEDRIGTFAGGALTKALAYVKDATGKDDYRIAMTGVYFDLRQRERPLLATTNSFILAKYAFTEEDFNAADKVRPFILPRAAADLIPALKDEICVTAVYAKSSLVRKTDVLTHVQFSDGWTEIISRIIDEKYPPYESVIPKGSSFTAEFNPKELLDGIKSVSSFANQTKQVVAFRYEPERCTIIAADDDSGLYSDIEIECAFTGESETYGFNYAFLADSINPLKSCERITMVLNETDKAVVIQDSGTQLTESLRLIMPVRLSDESISKATVSKVNS